MVPGNGEGGAVIECSYFVLLESTGIIYLTPHMQHLDSNGESADLGGEAGAPEKLEALEMLAKKLHSKMEHLDPTGKPTWADLDEFDREFYRSCVEAVIDDRNLLNLASD